MINNAIKFTNEGTIKVTTEKTDGYVLVNIKDTGTGIDAGVLPSLFTKFVTKSDEGLDLDCIFQRVLLRLMEERYGRRII